MPEVDSRRSRRFGGWSPVEDRATLSHLAAVDDLSSAPLNRIRTLDELRTLGIARFDEVDLVELTGDGGPWFAGFCVNEEEHQRRLDLGIGAVVDRRLLHALWALPEDVDVEESALSATIVATLNERGAFLVDHLHGRLRRVFRPAGSVRTATVVGRCAENAVRRISHLPPIYSRLAVVEGEVSEAAAGLARRRRVGLVVARSGRYSVGVEPPRPILGSPAVYRWWVSELAYERWRSRPLRPSHELILGFD